MLNKVLILTLFIVTVHGKHQGKASKLRKLWKQRQKKRKPNRSLRLKDRKVMIFLRTETGRLLPLKLPGDATVAILREAARTVGMDLEQTTFKFAGEVLSDPKALLSDLGVCSSKSVVDVSSPVIPQKSTEALTARVEELWEQDQLVYRLVNQPDLDLSNLYPTSQASVALPILAQNSEEYLFASTSIGGNTWGEEFGYAPTSAGTREKALYGILLDPWELDEYGILFGGKGDLDTKNEHKTHRVSNEWHLKTKHQIAQELLDDKRGVMVPHLFFNEKYIDDSATIYTEEKKNLKKMGEIISETSRFKTNELVVSFKANAVLGIFTRDTYPDELWMKAQHEFLLHFGIRLPVFQLQEGVNGSNKLVLMENELADT